MDSIGTALPLVLFILLAILTVVAGILSYKAQQKRLAELAALSQSLGLQFYPEGVHFENEHNFFGLRFTSSEDAVAAKMSVFSLFQQGHSREAKPVMKGRLQEIDWMLFDYQYKVTTSNGKSTTTTNYPFSICVAQVPYMLPGLSMEPQNWLHNFGQLFGSSELQVESEEFNKRYFIQSSDNRAAMDLLHPQALEVLLQQPVRRWQCVGPFLMIYTSGHIQAAEYYRLFEDAKAFVGTVPNYFKKDNSLG